jgi:DNA-binding transcriptional ArsR family regulator
MPAEPETPDSSAEPGTLGNPIKLTDPRMMRALAHPARIAIWTHLGMRGPATATECAEIAGLSPSACSYHLRALARYGFVEEDPESAADGRQRPWRARLLAFTMQQGPGEPAAANVAGRLLVENVRAAMEETRARYLDRQSEYPADWQAAAGEVFSVAHVTPDELTRLRTQVQEVMALYIRLDPAERPTGALPVRVMLDLFPWFKPEEARKPGREEDA